jgi:hypothetical protein
MFTQLELIKYFKCKYVVQVSILELWNSSQPLIDANHICI